MRKLFSISKLFPSYHFRVFGSFRSGSEWNSIMKFHLKPQDESLIKAALCLGDWLLAYPGTTQEQKAVILLLQNGSSKDFA